MSNNNIDVDSVPSLDSTNVRVESQIKGWETSLSNRLIGSGAYTGVYFDSKLRTKTEANVDEGQGKNVLEDGSLSFGVEVLHAKSEAIQSAGPIFGQYHFRADALKGLSLGDKTFLKSSYRLQHVLVKKEVVLQGVDLSTISLTDDPLLPIVVAGVEDAVSFLSNATNVRSLMRSIVTRREEINPGQPLVNSSVIFKLIEKEASLSKEARVVASILLRDFFDVFELRFDSLPVKMMISREKEVLNVESLARECAASNFMLAVADRGHWMRKRPDGNKMPVAVFVDYVTTSASLLKGSLMLARTRYLPVGKIVDIASTLILLEAGVPVELTDGVMLDAVRSAKHLDVIKYSNVALLNLIDGRSDASILQSLKSSFSEVRELERVMDVLSQLLGSSGSIEIVTPEDYLADYSLVSAPYSVRDERRFSTTIMRKRKVSADSLVHIVEASLDSHTRVASRLNRYSQLVTPLQTDLVNHIRDAADNFIDRVCTGFEWLALTPQVDSAHVSVTAGGVLNFVGFSATSSEGRRDMLLLCASKYDLAFSYDMDMAGSEHLLGSVSFGFVGSDLPPSTLNMFGQIAPWYVIEDVCLALFMLKAISHNVNTKALDLFKKGEEYITGAIEASSLPDLPRRINMRHNVVDPYSKRTKAHLTAAISMADIAGINIDDFASGDMRLKTVGTKDALEHLRVNHAVLGVALDITSVFSKGAFKDGSINLEIANARNAMLDSILRETIESGRYTLINMVIADALVKYAHASKSLGFSFGQAYWSLEVRKDVILKAMQLAIMMSETATVDVSGLDKSNESKSGETSIKAWLSDSVANSEIIAGIVAKMGAKL